MSKTRKVALKFGSGSQSLRQPYQCEIVRSKRKTMALHISHKKVEVRCPPRASLVAIQAFVQEIQDWIQQRLYEESRLARESLRIEKGAKIFFRARERTIVFKEHRKHRILINGDQFIIQGHKLNSTKARQQVEEYLIEKASEYLIPRARGLARYLGVDHKLKEIKLRKTKSKWGHCTSTGIIQYNWLIMLAPYSIIDYMITHEVCHLIHMDHSARYWSLVDSICPDSEHYVKWLKEHEHRFWF